MPGFHALSDPLRIKVLELLRQQELCVCELCDRLHANQSTLSFHLKTLKKRSSSTGAVRGPLGLLQPQFGSIGDRARSSRIPSLQPNAARLRLRVKTILFT